MCCGESVGGVAAKVVKGWCVGQAEWPVRRAARLNTSQRSPLSTLLYSRTGGVPLPPPLLSPFPDQSTSASRSLVTRVLRTTRFELWLARLVPRIRAQLGPLTHTHARAHAPAHTSVVHRKRGCLHWWRGQACCERGWAPPLATPHAVLFPSARWGTP